ncbi:putative DNA polymerase III epsilon chain [Buchnera aphidicola str. Bp (Baizongia pistaciae)]|uniref:DNA polymerase III subunit epsilon n=1 Tax=Buchnera aphidicola subsp. Baizongia pistaciae (strain Bp) TaxID=224915 RepID=DPO3E_BUCBP|nr:DNA polymerase III subunit epsilon [Buchnera aphidicola]Q89AN3.1 RecName: Full=DNA polymerase III subunit epsilon [Buchnera aphidicola str. Bp (Baizongia pistaciae)]AAO26958.1 putative DNA polymerase III epsilon chain [Buchnera aphidicola str. Bp (Baizongia pistaciae)]
MKKYDRKIVLDIETTGMNPAGCFYKNHKIIEIGAVEMINNVFTGNNFHSYIQPNRLIDKQSFKIHGITDNFLLDKPKFHEISVKFLEYITNSDLIIHNAKFDVGFINYELNMINSDKRKISDYCNVVDTLPLARQLFPGKKNSLDALCNRYKINVSHRDFHSALIDAKLLAKVYTFMTSFQQSISIFDKNSNLNSIQKNAKLDSRVPFRSTLLLATKDELQQHMKYLKYVKQETGNCVWLEDKYN